MLKWQTNAQWIEHEIAESLNKKQKKLEKKH